MCQTILKIDTHYSDLSALSIPVYDHFHQGNNNSRQWCPHDSTSGLVTVDISTAGEHIPADS